MIHILAHFALLLRDDFSGAVIADGGQRFTVNGRPARPIRKPEGFFVFTDLPPEARWLVRIESPRHFPCTVSVEPAPAPGALPQRTVMLYRKPHSGFADCGWLERPAPAGALAAVLFQEDPPLALRQCTPEGAIYLRGYTASNLLWRRICVGEGRAGELFTLTRRLPDGGYAVDHPPRGSHSEGAPVYMAACAPAVEKGVAAIPIQPGRDSPAAGGIYDEEAMRWLEIWSAPVHK